MRRLIETLGTREQGSVMILFGLCVTLVFGMAALALDTGIAYVYRSRLQSAADSAALAGASRLPDKIAAETEAADYLSTNGVASYAVDWPTAYNTRIKVSVGQTSPTFFARVLGVGSTSIKATATASGLPRMAEYALFSGNDSLELAIKACNSVINGGVHTNAVLRVTGSNNTFNGVVDYADPSPAPTAVNSFQPGSPCQTTYVKMPDFAAQLQALAGVAKTHVGDLVLTESSSPFTVDEVLYVTGKVSINGDKIRGKGYLLSEGAMDIRGNSTELFAGSKVCFYSKTSGIKLRGDYGKFTGILYAPAGCISLTGVGLQIKGGVYGDTIDYTEDIQVTYDEAIVEDLLGKLGTVRLVR